VGLGILALFPLGLAVLLSFLALIGTSIVCGWRNRRDLRLALTALAAPFVSLGLFLLALSVVWRGWGILPWTTDKTVDFALDQTLPSPDGVWRAIYGQDLSGGPATGTGFDVYVVHGTPNTLFYKDRVFSAECIKDLQMQWIGPRTLRISYSIGDTDLSEGLLQPPPIPFFHDQQDVWKQTDPVKTVEVRRIVQGSLCR
jgi:hypothetical protein